MGFASRTLGNVVFPPYPNPQKDMGTLGTILLCFKIFCHTLAEKVLRAAYTAQQWERPCLPCPTPIPVSILKGTSHKEKAMGREEEKNRLRHPFLKSQSLWQSTEFYFPWFPEPEANIWCNICGSREGSRLRRKITWFKDELLGQIILNSKCSPTLQARQTCIEKQVVSSSFICLSIS